jgi:hypothetical protein
MPARTSPLGSMLASCATGSPRSASSRAPTARTPCAARRSQIYKKTGNLRAVQLLLTHTKMDSTVCYLGVDLDDALTISEGIDL